MKRARRTRSTYAGVESSIRDALSALKPLLHFETARIELVEFNGDTGVAVVHVAGDCPECDLTAPMLREGIEAHLRTKIPEIREIRVI
ncbi:MAG: NifU family protein [Gemmatimonadaceae bacterium]|nr:NifU family protein [Gemmatimonadaceae bacterium]MDQ3518930.1 NifU family protein [Gemmatimonadota bacterium]